MARRLRGPPLPRRSNLNEVNGGNRLTGSNAPVMRVCRRVDLLDAHSADGPGDDQLLNLAGAFEDRVAHGPGFSGYRRVMLDASEQRFHKRR